MQDLDRRVVVVGVWMSAEGTGRRTVTFYGWEGDRRPGEKQYQPTAGDDLTSTQGSVLGPTLGNQYGRTLPVTVHYNLA